MYTSYYAESSQLSGSCQKSNEVEALNHLIDCLKEAKVQGIQSAVGINALYQTNLVWCFLLEDLAKPENSLPDQLKADLVSIGLFILKEVERIRQNENDNLDALIELNIMISTGLAQ